MKITFVTVPKDINITNRIRAAFEANGAACFEISADLLPGQDRKYAQNAAMKESDYVVVILSKNFYETRGFHGFQIARALEYADYSPSGGRYILPVIIDDCKEHYRKSSLSHLKPMDLTKTNGRYENEIWPLLT